MRKRVLIVTYYFPPFTGVGVFRILKFAKYINREIGSVTVLAPQKAYYYIVDYNLMRYISENRINVKYVSVNDKLMCYGYGVQYDVASPEKNLRKSRLRGFGYKVFRKAHRFFTSPVTIPDPQIFWVPKAIKEGLWLVTRENFDVLLTSGKPFSVHLIGMMLKRKTGIKWLADFRDPWSTNPYFDTKTLWKKLIEKKLEEKVFGQADYLIFTSEDTMNEMACLYPQFSWKMRTITNKFDPEEFAEYPPNFRTFDSNRSTIKMIYTGALFGGKEPYALLQAIRELQDYYPNIKDRIHILFIGKLLPGKFDEYLQDEKLKVMVEYLPYMPHKDVLKVLGKCDIGILTIGRNPRFKHLIPAKLYDYMGAGLRVLAFLPADYTAAKIVRKTGIGLVIDPSDVGRIKAVLEDLLGGKNPFPRVRLELINEYSMQQAISELRELIIS